MPIPLLLYEYNSIYLEHKYLFKFQFCESFYVHKPLFYKLGQYKRIIAFFP